MKKNVITIFFLLITTIVFSQAKKPIIMVVPSDNWCVQNGYVVDFEGDKFPDYRKAFQEDFDLTLVINKINELMAERGFPLKNLESTLKSITKKNAQNKALSSKSGASVAESPIDELKKEAQADIWIQLNWKKNVTGPKKSITFQLQGLDAYSDKQVAGASGTGQPSFSSETPALLEEAVLAHLDNFNAQLQNHFNDMAENGREIILELNVWDSWGKDFETEIGGKELREIIENWVQENTVAGRFSISEDSETRMSFEQVRIPLYDKDNKALDTAKWGEGLRKYLKSTYQIESKRFLKGLGGFKIILGAK